MWSFLSDCTRAFIKLPKDELSLRVRTACPIGVWQRFVQDRHIPHHTQDLPQHLGSCWVSPMTVNGTRGDEVCIRGTEYERALISEGAAGLDTAR